MVNVKTISFKTIKVVLFCAAAAFQFGACKKNNSASESDGYKAIEKTFDDKEAADKKSEPQSKEPVQGADLEGMGDKEKLRFETLVDSMMSPCGKAHSLRTSRNTDSSCLRAPFAVNFVLETIKDGAADAEIKEAYRVLYKGTPQKYGFSLDGSPHTGPADSQVTIVEFYDYGCPACRAQKPVLEKLVTDYPGQVSLFYKMYPLASHVDSPGAAQAALAAHKQGKFKDMHNILFENQHDQQINKLEGYAKKIGLNMKQYKADFAAAEAMVKKDREEGESSNVQGTPSIYINGVSYQGPNVEKYMKMAIDEAIALSR